MLIAQLLVRLVPGWRNAEVDRGYDRACSHISDDGDKQAKKGDRGRHSYRIPAEPQTWADRRKRMRERSASVPPRDV